MKKLGSRNLLLAMLAIFAMGGFIFGCTDETTETTQSATNPSLSLKGSIQGQVFDVNDNVVANATATMAFPGGTTEVTTNSAGQFLFENVPVSGQLSIQPDYYEYEFGSGNPYLITVQAEGYETSFTAALLTFAALESSGQIEVIGGELQAVGNLMVAAIPTTMRKAIGVLTGSVNQFESGVPVSGALVSLSQSGVPDPWDIWYTGNSDWAISDNTAITGGEGGWTISTVPEGEDADPACYTITISAAGFATLSGGSGCVGSCRPKDDVIPTFCADANSDDDDPCTAFLLKPDQPHKDIIHPYVTTTNLPVAKIAEASLSGPFWFTWNEAMKTELGEVLITLPTGAPITCQVKETWDTTTDPNHPVVTVNLQTSEGAECGLQMGVNVNFKLKNFFDVNGNAYQGTDPDGNADAFKSQRTSVDLTTVALSTVGDPTLMVADNVVQDPAALNPAQPIGGLSGNSPQANNLNLLFLLNQDPIVTTDAIGDVTGEANKIFLSWEAASGLDGEGVVRYYKVYSELATGGFVDGIPVPVVQTPPRLDGNPDTSIDLTLKDVQNAIVDYNDGTDDVLGNSDDPVPQLPTVTEENLTDLYFDNGFTLNMAVTAVNSDDREGPYALALVPISL